MTRTENREAPGKRLTLEVRGGCMRPLLRHGDSVLVDEVPAEALRWGDLVVVMTRTSFTRFTTPPPSLLAVHRLIWKSRREGWTLWTKGDAAPALDASTPESGLVGRVVAVHRGEGPWTRLDGWAGAGHRAVGLLANLAFLARPLALGTLALLSRAVSENRALRPARRALLRAALALEDL